jgi:hypothetical protein
MKDTVAAPRYFMQSDAKRSLLGATLVTPKPYVYEKPEEPPYIILDLGLIIKAPPTMLAPPRGYAPAVELLYMGAVYVPSVYKNS